MLNKERLKSEIKLGLKDIYLNQARLATEGDERESPEDVIERITQKMSQVISDAIEVYVKSGDIYITNENITVVAPNGPATVTTINPIKIR